MVRLSEARASLAQVDATETLSCMHYRITGTHVEIIGSLHLFPAESPDLPSWVQTAYARCEALLFEADPTKNASSHLLYLPDNEDLEAVVTPAGWQFLQTHFPTNESQPPLSSHRPWLASLKAFGNLAQAARGVEFQLLDAAITDMRPVFFLEVPDFQAELFCAIPHAIVNQSLELMATDPKRWAGALAQTHELWHKWDGYGLAALADQSPLFSIPTIREAILTDRNRTWIDRIWQAAQYNVRLLIVVGAHHLIGPDSVPDLLTKAGLNLELVDRSEN